MDTKEINELKRRAENLADCVRLTKDPRSVLYWYTKEQKEDLEQRERMAWAEWENENRKNRDREERLAKLNKKDFITRQELQEALHGEEYPTGSYMTKTYSFRTDESIWGDTSGGEEYYYPVGLINLPSKFEHEKLFWGSPSTIETKSYPEFKIEYIYDEIYRSRELGERDFCMMVNKAVYFGVGFDAVRLGDLTIGYSQNILSDHDKPSTVIMGTTETITRTWQDEWSEYVEAARAGFVPLLGPPKLGKDPIEWNFLQRAVFLTFPNSKAADVIEKMREGWRT
jgi:hypothetical protein